MSSADIGANFDSHQGDPIAGGENGGVLKIDTSPIMQLAHYTVQYNREKWRQDINDANDKINSLAQISTLNPNDAVPKDKDEALKAYNDLVAYGSGFAKKTFANNQDKTVAYLDWQAKLGDASKLINSANGRSKAYQARQGVIKSSPLNPDQQTLRLKELDKEVNSTDIYTPISAVDQKFDLRVPTIGDPSYAKIEVLKTDPSGNGKLTNTHTLLDPETMMSSAFLTSQGLDRLRNKVPSNDIERQQLDLENASDNDQKVWGDASDFLTKAIQDPKYKGDNGEVDLDKIESNNPLVANIVGLANRWNDYANKVKSDIGSGVYTDDSGNTLVDPKKYFTIDPKQGISPSQMVFLEQFAKAKPDALETKYVHTGDATAAAKVGIERQKANADAIYKRTMGNAAGMKAKAYVDNVHQQMKIRKSGAEQDQMLDDLFTRNLTQQPTLIQSAGKDRVNFNIKSENSLPLFTFDGKTPKQLIPIDAKPVYSPESYKADAEGNKELKIGAKPTHYEGGHYNVNYIFQGKNYGTQEVADLYANFKKVQGSKWQGSIDDFLKQGVAEGQFDARIIGANGATDKLTSIAAQRAISNNASGKGERPVFSTDDNPPTDEQVNTNNSNEDY